jgi:hypothetical protein
VIIQKMAIQREPQFNENGQQIGEISICTPNNNDLEEEQRKYCDNLILKKAQKENPDLFWSTVQHERGRLLLLERQEGNPSSIQFHDASTLTNTTTNNDNNSNALRMYSLMKKIVGSNDDYDYGYYQNNNIKEEDTPRFHKASTNTENNVTNDQNQQIQNNNNDFLKHYELMKMIASCASPFEP